VAATNSLGRSPASAPSPAVTPTNATLPGAPTGVAATGRNASVALSWSAPASDGGAAITSYRITPYVGGVAQAPLDTGSPSTSYPVTGLLNGTAYAFPVAATNAVGTGPASSPSGSVTPASTYTNVVFSDGFESGSTSAWTVAGTGTASAAG